MLNCDSIIGIKVSILQKPRHVLTSEMLLHILRQRKSDKSGPTCVRICFARAAELCRKALERLTCSCTHVLLHTRALWAEPNGSVYCLFECIRQTFPKPNSCHHKSLCPLYLKMATMKNHLTIYCLIIRVTLFQGIFW